MIRSAIEPAVAPDRGGIAPFQGSKSHQPPQQVNLAFGGGGAPREVVMAQTAEVTSDRWIVTDLRAFRTLTEYAPPRPWRYWDQIRCDLHEPKIVVRMWVTGLGLTAAGVILTAAAVATRQWVLALGGLLIFRGLRLLALWVRLARGTVRSFRAHPVATGVVGRFEPHPIVPTIIAVGRATRPSGEPVDVGAEVPLARAIERAGTPAEVWFLDDPSSQYRGVFAGRPVGPHPGAAEAAEPGAAAERAGGR
jgi:hypothetical protein